MKKYLILLTAVSISMTMHAQQTIIDLSYVPPSKTDAMFYGPTPKIFNIKFDFRLPASNKMTLYFNSFSQVDSLPRIDSLLTLVWNDLQNFRDSLEDPLSNRRIDYFISPIDHKIRIQQFPQKGGMYSIGSNGVTQLKLEQDTLNIKMYTRFTRKFNGKDIIGGSVYFVTFLLNHITDLPEIISNEKLQASVEQLRRDLSQLDKKTRSMFSKYLATYDVSAGTRVAPKDLNKMNYGSKKTYFIPYVQIGVQYVRGAWSPSAGAGFDLEKKLNADQSKHYRLMWEPYFFFNRNSSNELGVARNDFVSFKYSAFSKIETGTKQIEFLQTMSIGYLIRRQGNWFEKHTIKFSLPGLQVKNILVEPEFFFNDLLKHFSPSLKLTLFLE